MKVLKCHNYYQQPGGEDLSFAAEAALLESRGHEVVEFTCHNDAIHSMSGWQAARRTVWNRGVYDELRALIRRERPAVMHCTNTFPLISPAAYAAARDEGVAVVQGLHNYRLLCPNALFLRDGKACEDCLGKLTAWPGVVRGCYRNSRPATAAVAAMLTVHRLRRTWTESVDMYYALTNFAREKFIAGGLPAEKLAIKPNFLHPDREPGDGCGGYAVFVGRLSEEKGIDVLLDAWRHLDGPLQLKIVGDGPLDGPVQEAARTDGRITWLGRRTPDETEAVVGDAACLVLPSVCYEGMPRTIIEAFAKGTPAVVSRLGGMQEMVDDNRTGMHFEPGVSRDLADKLTSLFADSDRLGAMRDEARQEYLEKYTADANYQMLMEIYVRALDRVEQLSPQPSSINFPTPSTQETFV